MLESVGVSQRKPTAMVFFRAFLRPLSILQLSNPLSKFSESMNSTCVKGKCPTFMSNQIIINNYCTESSTLSFSFFLIIIISFFFPELETTINNNHSESPSHALIINNIHESIHYGFISSINMKQNHYNDSNKRYSIIYLSNFCGILFFSISFN